MIAQEILTHQSKLTESSGYSLEGSFTRDLIASKVWLLTELARVAPTVGTIYVLGSWYGNLGVLLALDPIVQYKKLINVETDQHFLQASRRILDHMGIDRAQYMLTDANKLDYRQLGSDGVVVNTSLNDMSGDTWFEHIPGGTLVAMQGRDHVSDRATDSTQDIVDRFPLSEVLYEGELKLADPETEYTRYMVIGVK